MGYRAVAKCDICERWMSREEVEACESKGLVVCDGCWFESASPTELELAEMFLAADVEQAERDTYYDNDSPLA